MNAEKPGTRLMRPDGLTERQAQFVRAVYRLTAANGRPPVAPEVMAALGIKHRNSVDGDSGFAAMLRRKGWLLAKAGQPYGSERGLLMLAGVRLRLTPLGVAPVFDTERTRAGLWRMTAQAERLWAVVFGTQNEAA